MFELITFPAQLHNGQARRLYQGNLLKIVHSIRIKYIYHYSVFTFYCMVMYYP